jgi:hypothetical protein
MKIDFRGGTAFDRALTQSVSQCHPEQVRTSSLELIRRVEGSAVRSVLSNCGSLSAKIIRKRIIFFARDDMAGDYLIGAADDQSCLTRS